MSYTAHIVLTQSGSLTPRNSVLIQLNVLTRFSDFENELEVVHFTPTDLPFAAHKIYTVRLVDSQKPLALKKICYSILFPNLRGKLEMVHFAPTDSPFAARLKFTQPMLSSLRIEVLIRFRHCFPCVTTFRLAFALIPRTVSRSCVTSRERIRESFYAPARDPPRVHATKAVRAHASVYRE